MRTSSIINTPCPGNRKMSHSSIAHQVSGVKCYTCSSVMPRPLQGCLGPPLSCIGVAVLPRCSLRSFTEGPSETTGFLPPFLLWNTSKYVPHPPYTMMLILAESFLSNGMKSHQYIGQSSSCNQVEHSMQSMALCCSWLGSWLDAKSQPVTPFILVEKCHYADDF